LEKKPYNEKVRSSVTIL